MEQLKRLVGAVDDFQQRHRWLAFPVAVVKKYGEDQAGHRAALLAYYGFFSLFPLLLLLTSVLGFLLERYPAEHLQNGGRARPRNEFERYVTQYDVPIRDHRELPLLEPTRPQP